MVLRCLWTSYDYLTCNTIQEDFVVGGIVDFQLFQYPESCKTVTKWTMREIKTVEQRLVSIPFPDPASVTESKAEVDLKMTLPKTIYMHEEQDSIKLAVWDADK